MTSWDVLHSIISGFSPVVAALMLVAAGVVFIIGFARHGMDFIKHGFKQVVLDSMFVKRFDDLAARMATKEDIAELRGEISGLHGEMDGLRNEMDGLRCEMDGFRTELSIIKENHFGHLKNFLTELTSILLDKNVINNQDKARLDNQLNGM